MQEEASAATRLSLSKLMSRAGLSSCEDKMWSIYREALTLTPIACRLADRTSALTFFRRAQCDRSRES